MGVPIDPAAQWLQAIVEMEGVKPVKPDDLIERLHRRSIFPFWGKGIPGGKNMTRIQAYAYSLGMGDEFQNTG